MTRPSTHGRSRDRRHRAARAWVVAWVAAALAAGACVPPAGRTGGIAPLEERLDDSTVAADLRRLDSLAAPPRPADGDDATLHGWARRAALGGLARDAYGRNAPDALAERLAAASASGGRVRGGAHPLWAFLDSATSAPGLSGRVNDVVALEVALVRSEHPALGAPDCAAWSREAEAIAARVRAGLVPPATAPEVVRAVVPDAPAAPKAQRIRLSAIPTRVHFGLDRSDLSRKSQRVLDAVVDSLRSRPEVRLVLQGHTDKRGNLAYNAALSRRRAEAVRDYLISRGLAAAAIRIEALASGELEEQGDDIVDHARNRRVKLRFYDMEGQELPAVDQLSDLQIESRRTPQGQARRTPQGPVRRTPEKPPR